MIYAPDYQFSPETQAALDLATEGSVVVLTKLESFPTHVPATLASMAYMSLKSLVICIRQDQDVSAVYEVLMHITNDSKATKKILSSQKLKVTKGKQWTRTTTTVEDLAQMIGDYQFERNKRRVSRVFSATEFSPGMCLVGCVNTPTPTYAIRDSTVVTPGWYAEMLAGDLTMYDNIVDYAEQVCTGEALTFPTPTPRRYYRQGHEKIFGMVKL